MTVDPPFSRKQPSPLFRTSLSFPHPQVLLVTINRPEKLNSLDSIANHELDAIWTWYDSRTDLRAAIVTGTGRKAFCAGADLKEWLDLSDRPARLRRDDDGEEEAEKKERTQTSSRTPLPILPPSGFGGLSRRVGKKPIIGAINGLAYGGGMEMVVNLDLVVADAARATFALPEVKRGVVAAAGALPRLIRTVGRQRAMEMALTGRTVGATEAKEWGLVNCVVENNKDVCKCYGFSSYVNFFFFRAGKITPISFFFFFLKDKIGECASQPPSRMESFSD